jgi:hypothetical protein
MFTAPSFSWKTRQHRTSSTGEMSKSRVRRIISVVRHATKLRSLLGSSDADSRSRFALAGAAPTLMRGCCDLWTDGRAVMSPDACARDCDMLEDWADDVRNGVNPPKYSFKRWMSGGLSIRSGQMCSTASAPWSLTTASRICCAFYAAVWSAVLEHSHVGLKIRAN